MPNYQELEAFLIFYYIIMNTYFISKNILAILTIDSNQSKF
jgi:hypothetical protein